MANGHGGPRTPRDPAPVSGPGALSQRTDGGPVDGQGRAQLPNAGYGEQQAFQEIQAGAPMAQATPVDTSGLTPLDAPTQYPGQDVTTGATLEDPDTARNLGVDAQIVRDNIRYLKVIASLPNAPAALRQFVRQAESDTTLS